MDEVDDAPLWPQDADIANRLPPISAAEARSGGLVSEVLALRIGLPSCAQPLLQQEENPVEQFMAAQRRQEKGASSSSAGSPHRSSKLRGNALPSSLIDEVWGEGATEQASTVAELTADGEPTARVRLPTRAELADLPEPLQRQITLAASQSLRSLLLPMLMVRQLRARRRALSAAEAPPPITVEFLQQRVGIMAPWPRAALEEVIRRLRPRACAPREIVAHLHEPTHEMLLLAHGHVRLSTRAATHRRQLLTATAAAATSAPAGVVGGTTAAGPGGPAGGASAAAKAAAASSNQIVSAPATFGEMSLMTEEPWTCFVRAHSLSGGGGGSGHGQASAAHFWCLRKSDFAEILETIPSHLVMNTIRTAFQRRKEAMRANYPFGPDKVRQHAPFTNVSLPFARAMADRCTPYAVPKKFVLCTEKEPCEGLFFLCRGALSAHRAGDGGGGGGGEGGGGGGDGGEGHRITAPAVVCAAELVHGSLNDATVRSTADSDLYHLSRAAFAALAQQFPRDADAVLDAARAQKCEEVLDNAPYFMEILQRMPIVRDCVPSYRLRQFLPLLRAKSYRPLTAVCSTASFCDRIILLTKGVLKLCPDEGAAGSGGGGGSHAATEGGGGLLLQAGDSIGWTCCVPHRWAVGVMSTHVTVEALEVSQVDLMNFLQAEGTLGTAVALSEQLMFPRAFSCPPPQLPPGHVPFYPISRSRKPNFNEPGFSTVHMGIMAEQARRERERKKRLQLNEPPPYRQVGSGVWIPSQKRTKM